LLLVKDKNKTDMAVIIKKEIQEAINKLNSLKSKYPTMRTRDVIEMLERIKGKL